MTWAGREGGGGAEGRGSVSLEEGQKNARPSARAKKREIAPPPFPSDTHQHPVLEATGLGPPRLHSHAGRHRRRAGSGGQGVDRGNDSHGF